MSYITYQVKCRTCGEIYNTAFGIVGMRIIAEPLQKCPKCGGAMGKHAEDWKPGTRENTTRRKGRIKVD